MDSEPKAKSIIEFITGLPPNVKNSYELLANALTSEIERRVRDGEYDLSRLDDFFNDISYLANHGVMIRQAIPENEQSSVLTKWIFQVLDQICEGNLDFFLDLYEKYQTTSALTFIQNPRNFGPYILRFIRIIQ